MGDEPRERREGDRRVQDALASDVAELREAVLGLSHRTEQLANNLSTVNELTARQQTIDEQSQIAIREAALAIGKVKALNEIVIPREEHEKRWKAEQEALITLRLRIKRRGLIQSVIVLALALVALSIAIAIVVKQNNANADQARKACQERVNINKQALPAYDQLLQSPTIDHDQVLRGFIELARESALKGAKVDCG